MNKNENVKSQQEKREDNNTKISLNILTENVDLVFERKGDTKECNEFYLNELEEYVKKYLKNSVTKTQMRNIFDTFKDCNSNDKMKLLKPKLMYFAGRINKNNAKKFIEQLIQLLDAMRDESDYKQMQKLVETILAYHKYYAKD
jgi:CRISPR type III-A-associated protein Csm2